MGISTSVVIVVGLHGSILYENGLDEDAIYELTNDLDFVQPSYDCSYKYGIIGIIVEDDTWFEIDDLELRAEPVLKAKEKFERITGFPAKVYISVWRC